jgi:gamma-glutamyltranspeptidase / glutathione hydrolase
MTHLHHFDWRALGLSLVSRTLFLPPSVHAQLTAPTPEAPAGRVAKHAVVATRDMVAAANPLAAQAGREILAAGGSAVDAAWR